MRKYVKFILGSLFIGAVAFGVAETSVDRITSPRPQWFQKGIYIGTTLKNVISDKLNKITSSGGGFGTFDPASQPAGTHTCIESPPITTQGAYIGDTCSVGSNFGVDGGVVGLIGAVSATCYVSANEVTKVRLCYSMADDAGAIDIADGGYTVRTFSTR